MNYGIIAKAIGSLLIVEAVLMLPPFFIAGYYDGQHEVKAFALSIILTAVAGFLITRVPKRSSNIRIREGIAIVSLGWILVSFFGSLPFIFSGSILSFADAFFETVSGFTTTGATVVADIESLPYGILFWRSFTIWIGGMGILVLTLAVLPAMGVGDYQIFKAETPGPIAGKIVPRIKDTAKILYIIYLGITVIEIILLVIGGMNLFDSTLHAFSTVGTGGFSTKNTSISFYNNTYIYMVISIFMLISGVNFSLYYATLKGRWREALKNEELWFYLGVVTVCTVLIAWSINGSIYKNIGESIKHSLFQVSSIITTTGYTTADYDTWTPFSKAILFMLLFFGPCAGSTGGAIKSIRVLALIKLIKREVNKVLHPRAVIPVKINKSALSQETLSGISSFFILYIFIFILGTLALTIEGKSLVTAASAAAATIGNIGPGFELVGPSRNFADFSDFGKYLMCGLMLMGRLELFRVIVMFSPRFWRGEL
ncbi:MAG TPA: TrkH family potassium uptake protein [Clostridiaceae bacterium]|nr:TrkH family potassium uptake protein [Clostridiaceae bacterium]